MTLAKTAKLAKEESEISSSEIPNSQIPDSSLAVLALLARVFPVLIRSSANRA
jgi:hypothetical protein